MARTYARSWRNHVAHAGDDQTFPLPSKGMYAEECEVLLRAHEGLTAYWSARG
jgi:hypothetical protein